MLKAFGYLAGFAAAFYAILLMAGIGSAGSVLAYQALLYEPGMSAFMAGLLGFGICAALGNRMPIVSAFVMLAVAGMLWLPTLLELPVEDLRLMSAAAYTLFAFAGLLLVGTLIFRAGKRFGVVELESD